MEPQHNDLYKELFMNYTHMISQVFSYRKAARFPPLSSKVNVFLHLTALNLHYFKYSLTPLKVFPTYMKRLKSLNRDTLK